MYYHLGFPGAHILGLQTYLIVSKLLGNFLASHSIASMMLHMAFDILAEFGAFEKPPP